MLKFKSCFAQSVSELGRTMVEIIAVLAIMGILSVGSFWLFGRSNQEREINDIIYQMNLQVTQIYSAIDRAGTFPSKDHLNRLLAIYEKEVGKYVISFQADPNSSGNDFVTQIMRSDGEPIKGTMCRALLMKMSRLKMAKDVSFSLKDEEMDDGSVQNVMIPLNGQTVDYHAICGG